MQGLLELANVPYVGAGVLGSAVGMDKAVMKTLFAAHGLPVVPYLTCCAASGSRDPAAITSRVAQRASATRSSSSPRTSARASASPRRRTTTSFDEAMELALQFDRKIVIEAGVPNAREIECAVLGNDDPRPRFPARSSYRTARFYDYTRQIHRCRRRDDAKFPPICRPRRPRQVRRLSVEAFRALEGAGMARVDFFVDGTDERAVPQRGEHDSGVHDDSACIRRCGRRAVCPTPR